VLALEGGVLALGGIQDTVSRNEDTVSEEEAIAMAIAIWRLILGGCLSRNDESSLRISRKLAERSFSEIVGACWMPALRNEGQGYSSSATAMS
jgi:hypothetical protein